MFIASGSALILIGVLNYLKVLVDVMKHTSTDELKNDISADKIFMNFMQNTSMEHLTFLQNLIKSNQLFFGTGFILIMVGTFLT